MRVRILTLALACTLAIALTAGPAAAFSFGGKGVKGSGDLETRELSLDDFEAIDLSGAFEVDITFGDRQSVSVTIDDNLWDLLEAEVHGDTFELGWNKSCRPDDDCRVEIVVRSLSEMSISGAGDVNIRGFEGDSFSFNLSGAADLDMEGEVDELEIQVSGAGDIDTSRLHARDVKVRISGAGSADVFASESINARVSGVGNINYWGDPDVEKVRTSGLGHIKRR